MFDTRTESMEKVTIISTPAQKTMTNPCTMHCSYQTSLQGIIPILTALLSTVGRRVGLDDNAGDRNGIAADHQLVFGFSVTCCHLSGVVSYLNHHSMEESVVEHLVRPGIPYGSRQAGAQINAGTRKRVSLLFVLGLQQHSMMQDAAQGIEPSSVVCPAPPMAWLYLRILGRRQRLVLVVQEGKGWISLSAKHEIPKGPQPKAKRTMFQVLKHSNHTDNICPSHPELQHPPQTDCTRPTSDAAGSPVGSRSNVAWRLRARSHRLKFCSKALLASRIQGEPSWAWGRVDRRVFGYRKLKV